MSAHILATVQETGGLPAVVGWLIIGIVAIVFVSFFTGGRKPGA